jgi:hypothetical protein
MMPVALLATDDAPVAESVRLADSACVGRQAVSMPEKSERA